MLLKVFVVKNTGICSEKIIEVKVPVTNFFCLIQIYTSSNDVPLMFPVDSDETRFFLTTFFKSSKFAAI